MHAKSKPKLRQMALLQPQLLPSYDRYRSSSRHAIRCSHFSGRHLHRPQCTDLRNHRLLPSLRLQQIARRVTGPHGLDVYIMYICVYIYGCKHAHTCVCVFAWCAHLYTHCIEHMYVCVEHQTKKFLEVQVRDTSVCIEQNMQRF